MFRRRRWTLGPLVLVLIGVSAAGQARGAIPPGPRPEVTGEASGLVVEWQAPRPEIILQADGTVRVTMPGLSSSV